MDNDDLKSAIALVDGATTESLDQIQKDITMILEGKEEDEIDKEEADKKKAEEEKKYQKGDDFGLNGLFSLFKIKKKKKDESDLAKGIPPDSEYEKVIRSQAILSANEGCFIVFDVYKKAHNMPSHSDPYRALG